MVSRKRTNARTGGNRSSRQSPSPRDPPPSDDIRKTQLPPEIDGRRFAPGAGRAEFRTGGRPPSPAAAGRLVPPLGPVGSPAHSNGDRGSCLRNQPSARRTPKRRK